MSEKGVEEGGKDSKGRVAEVVKTTRAHSF